VYAQAAAMEQYEREIERWNQLYDMIADHADAITP